MFKSIGADTGAVAAAALLGAAVGPANEPANKVEAKTALAATLDRTLNELFFFKKITPCYFPSFDFSYFLKNLIEIVARF